MLKFFRILFLPFCLVAVTAACSPRYDWREVRADDGFFTVLLPAKPATFARPVNLGGTQVTMTMTAAEAGAMTFAVGSATLPDATQAQAALTVMKNALVKNINGTITAEKPVQVNVVQHQAASIDIEATGTANARPVRLFAHLFARGNKIVQVLAVGGEQAINREEVDTFFRSFKVY